VLAPRQPVKRTSLPFCRGERSFGGRVSHTPVRRIITTLIGPGLAREHDAGRRTPAGFVFTLPSPEAVRTGLGSVPPTKPWSKRHIPRRASTEGIQLTRAVILRPGWGSWYDPIRVAVRITPIPGGVLMGRGWGAYRLS
jgi:hypothetical protein